MEEIKIEKGVPVPAPRERGTSVTAVLRKLKVGDCAKFPVSLWESRDKARNNLGASASRLFGAGRFAVRTEGEFVRVWRTA